jgi:hypothetical protein
MALRWYAAEERGIGPLLADSLARWCSIRAPAKD